MSVAVVKVRAVTDDVTRAATPVPCAAAGPAPTGAWPEVTFLSDMTVELVRHAARDEDVLFAARVSTQGEHSLAQLDADASKSRGLVNYLMRDRHGSPFEHNSMTFYVHAPIFVFREFMRHRIGYCLAGDTNFTPSERSFRRDTCASVRSMAQRQSTIRAVPSRDWRQLDMRRPTSGRRQREPRGCRGIWACSPTAMKQSVRLPPQSRESDVQTPIPGDGPKTGRSLP